jgi:hypothetical protein
MVLEGFDLPSRVNKPVLTGNAANTLRDKKGVQLHHLLAERVKSESEFLGDLTG